MYQQIKDPGEQSAYLKQVHASQQATKEITENITTTVNEKPHSSSPPTSITESPATSITESPTSSSTGSPAFQQQENLRLADDVTDIYNALTSEGKRQVADFIKTSQKLQVEKPLSQQDLNGNETTHEIPSVNVPVTAPEIASFIPPHFTPQSILADTAMKSVVANITELGDRLGVEIAKSEDMKVTWTNHLQKLNEYIKSLENSRWKSIMGWTACLFTITGFLWYMGALRQIPNFTANLISALPASTFTKTSTVVTDKAVTSPTLSAAYDAITENPLMPIVTLSLGGAVIFSIGMLKTAVWILRKIPK